jgi:hypothetical protein
VSPGEPQEISQSGAFSASHLPHSLHWRRASHEIAICRVGLVFRRRARTMAVDACGVRLDRQAAQSLSARAATVCNRTSDVRRSALSCGKGSSNLIEPSEGFSGELIWFRSGIIRFRSRSRLLPGSCSCGNTPRVQLAAANFSKPSRRSSSCATPLVLRRRFQLR